jgi:hypothetical protein
MRAASWIAILIITVAAAIWLIWKIFVKPYAAMDRIQHPDEPETGEWEGGELDALRGPGGGVANAPPTQVTNGRERRISQTRMGNIVDIRILQNWRRPARKSP